MSINFTSLKKLAEGKTKIIYENPEDDKTVFMVFKDDITAGDGVKHDIIKGKALVDWKTNRNIFELLNRKGVRTHYISSPQEKVVFVKKLDRKINLEVVSRRVAAGSVLKWGDKTEGARFDPVITQFHYKDDPLHDPMLDESYIDYIIRAKKGKEYVDMRKINAEVFLHLERAFANYNIQLVDLKLEYGIIRGNVYLIDEITGGSFRLWPYAHKNPNLKQSNVLKELDPEGRLDKDTYRMGENVNKVLTKFEEIAKVTAKFRDLWD
jgi:phosphoribosylaminoimidazole-succinocarboxamide synthase